MGKRPRGRKTLASESNVSFKDASDGCLKRQIQWARSDPFPSFPEPLFILCEWIFSGIREIFTCLVHWLTAVLPGDRRMGKMTFFGLRHTQGM